MLKGTSWAHTRERNKPISLRFEQGAVRGFLHRPVHEPSAGLVLTHGAGGNCESPLLVAVADAFCRAGIAVLRLNLPFRERKRFGPPLPAAAKESRAALREGAAALRKVTTHRIFLGGHSYGGRQASMLAAEDAEVADALLLLSYPLHPPGKADELRTDHFPELRTPVFFVHGTKDPFGSIEEMSSAVRLIAAEATLVALEGAGHDLARGKFDIERLVVMPFMKLFTQSPLRRVEAEE